jgi:hypothetical protein
MTADLPQRLSFQYVPLIQCSFPHPDPGAQSSFARRNGCLELTLSSARGGHRTAVQRAGTAADDLLRRGGHSHALAGGLSRQERA